MIFLFSKCIIDSPFLTKLGLVSFPVVGASIYARMVMTLTSTNNIHRIKRWHVTLYQSWYKCHGIWILTSVQLWWLQKQSHIYAINKDDLHNMHIIVWLRELTRWQSDRVTSLDIWNSDVYVNSDKWRDIVPFPKVPVYMKLIKLSHTKAFDGIRILM